MKHKVAEKDISHEAFKQNDDTIGGAKGTIHDGIDSEMSGVSFSQPPSQQHN